MPLLVTKEVILPCRERYTCEHNPIATFFLSSLYGQ